MILLQSDKRDYKFHQHFGQVFEFEDEFIVKESVPDVVQKPGDVECTCITCADIGSDKDGFEYDYQDLFNRIPHDGGGADPRDALGETVKDGLLPKGQTQRIKTFNSYWTAHTGSQDAFDNVRSALFLAKYPVAVWTPWFDNWTNDVLLNGGRPVSNHMYTIEGWKVVNGEPMLQIEAWVGRKMYMSRKTFNNTMTYDGVGSAVLSTAVIDSQRQNSLLKTLKDLLNKLIAYWNGELVKQQALEQVSTTPVVSQSQKFYDLAFDQIGKHLTLNNTVSKEFGCAQAISKLFALFGNKQMLAMGISSTQELEKWLIMNCDEIKTPELGCIIISVSYTGIAGARGHVGVVGLKAIISNESSTGLFEPYWSMGGWLGHYQTELKLRTRYFKVR